MPLSFDVYWSFRSPYSYLATPRLVELAREYDLTVNVKPVLPLAVRKPEFFEQVNPLWPPYLLRDTYRIAQYLGLDYGWPRPDPVVQEFPSRKIAAEQPYAPRLTRAQRSGMSQPASHIEIRSYTGSAKCFCQRPAASSSVSRG